MGELLFRTSYKSNKAHVLEKSIAVESMLSSGMLSDKLKSAVKLPVRTAYKTERKLV